jgi:SSS family solute:Na+ symporter/sodium/proline symporter
VYQRFINKNPSPLRIMVVSRLIVVFLGLFAVLQASQFQSVLKASLYAYTVYGAAVTPSVMAVFFWRRSNTAGAVSSIVLGTVVTVAWQLLQKYGPPAIQAGIIGKVDAVYPALIASVLSLIIVSLLTPPPSAKQLAAFETS